MEAKLFQSGHGGSKIPATSCFSVPEQRLLISRPWQTNRKMRLNTCPQCGPHTGVDGVFSRIILLFGIQLEHIFPENAIT